MIVSLLAAGHAPEFWCSSAFRVQQENVVVLGSSLDRNQLHVDSSRALTHARPHLDAKHDVQQSRFTATLHAHNRQHEDPLGFVKWQKLFQVAQSGLNPFHVDHVRVAINQFNR